MIPHYFLYEELKSDIEPTFLHIEPIRTRSSRHGWTIRTHTHPNHHQILILDKGGGTIEVEREDWDLSPKSLIVVPALTVHGFRFKRDTNGYVITVASSFLRNVFREDPELLNGFLKPARFLHSQLGEEIDLRKLFVSLQREFVWAAPGRGASIKAYLQLIAVAIGRLHGQHHQPHVSGARDVDTVIRFRELVEEVYRNHPPLATLARKLGVTTARLNSCCREVTGKSSLALINDRVLTEAKRKLLYSEETIAEIGASLGFADPGYFNRFFTRGVGISPGRFRHNSLNAVQA
ncbi:helix-turn-helix domain-containing protein [Rhodopseudomonas sp. P2A-2r]|uniref:helix-turn-helix domain-containing protein n=1 Tax=Rhodopseudomonas sp. P2A-2r TaxID=2991972 RepID=UPI002233FEDE|nr:helix-turn-helix domain-containing protein [Rhodopseudomonas sp. P2A-2r]UZE51054.1 helix-turn-helix domain-containing protein [Rhodopseudomonas sp. P2A-2r]